jgi:hypothetical protein
MTRPRLGVNTAAPGSRYKPLLHIGVVIRVAGRFVTSHNCYSERPAAREVRSRWLGRSKIDDHNVIYPPHNMAVRTSDRLHGTTRLFPFPHNKDQWSGAP